MVFTLEYMHILDSLSRKLENRRSEALYRRRILLESPQGAVITVQGQALVNFCGNDYLGLSSHPELIAASQDGAARWGVGSGASHLVCGHFAPHQAFEEAFAAWVGKPAALSFSTGYMGNLAVITALVGRGDAIFADRLNHASLNDAALLSRAEFCRYPHGDVDTLARQLAANQAKQKIIVSDAVFSMDGDLAPIAELLALAEQYDAWLFLDDAHGFGVLGGGRGSLAETGCDSPRLIYLATLGKAAGVAGAVVAAEAVVIDWLINMAHSYVYTTAAPPLLAVALQKSLQLIADEPWRRERLQAHVAAFRSGLGAYADQLLPSLTPIQPLLLKDSAQALHVAQCLREQGFLVAAIRPPTVPTARLRVTFSAEHTTAQVAALTQSLGAILGVVA